MRLARKTIATTLFAAASAIPLAVVFSTTAAADPVPAPAPALPNMAALPFLSALTPANAPMLLQGLASTFGGGGATATPATPATAALAPLAPAAALPVAATPATLAAPLAAPVAAPLAAPLAPTPIANGAYPAALQAAPAALPAPLGAAQSLVPTAEVNLPQVPLLPLPKQLSFPGDLASLMPAGTPLANLLPAAAAAPAAVSAAAPAVPAAASPLASAITPTVDALSTDFFPAYALP